MSDEALTLQAFELVHAPYTFGLLELFRPHVLEGT